MRAMLYLLFSDLALRSGVQALWLVKLFLCYLMLCSLVKPVLKEPAASIFRVQNEQEGSSFLQNVGTYVPNDTSYPTRALP